MATYSRLPAIPSKELSEVVVQSFDNITEDDSFDFKKLEKTIINAIEKANGDNKQLTVGESLTTISRRKTTETFDKVNKQIDKGLEEVFKELNKFSNNPLKGVSDVIDNGFKGFFKTIDDVWNTSIGDIAKNVKESYLVKKVGNIATSIGGFGKAVTSRDDLGYLLKEEQDKKIRNIEETNRYNKTEKTRQAQLVEEEKISKSTGFLSTTIGVFVTIVGVIATLIPPVVGAIAGLINSLDIWFNELLVDVKTIISPSSPGSIFTQISNALTSWAVDIPLLGHGGLSDAEYKEYKLLRSGEKVSKDYQERLEKLQATFKKYGYDFSLEQLSADGLFNSDKAKVNQAINKITGYGNNTALYAELNVDRDYIRNNKGVYEKFKNGFTDEHRDRLAYFNNVIGVRDTSEEAILNYKLDTFASQINNKYLAGELTELDYNRARASRYGGKVESIVGEREDLNFAPDTLLDKLEYRGKAVTENIIDLGLNLYNNVWTGESHTSVLSKQ